MGLLTRIAETTGQFLNRMETVRKSVAAPAGGYAGAFSGGPFVDRFGRQQAPSAVELVANNLGVVYACNQLNSKTVAKTYKRLMVKTRNGESRSNMGNRGETKRVSHKSMEWLLKSVPNKMQDAMDVEEVTFHPILNLLNKPTPQARTGVNGYTLMDATQQFQELVGRAYWYVERDGPMRTPSAIWILSSQWVVENAGFGPEDPVILSYDYAVGRGKTRFYPDEIVPFRMVDPNSGIYLGGVSPLRAAFEATRLSRNADGLTNNRVENGGMPSAVWAPKGEFSSLGPAEAKRLSDRMRVRLGAAGAGGIFIAESAGELSPLSWTTNEIIEFARYELTEKQVARCYGVPWTKLNRDNANRASAESGDYAHAADAIVPRLKSNEEAINDGLIPMYGPEAAERLFIVYDPPEGLIDEEFQHKRYELAVNSGAVTRNQQRIVIGLEEEPWGDQPYVKKDMVPILPDGKPDPAYGAKPPTAPGETGPDGKPIDPADPNAPTDPADPEKTDAPETDTEDSASEAKDKTEDKPDPTKKYFTPDEVKRIVRKQLMGV